MTGRVSLPKCRHCRKAIVKCEARPPHAGCSSALGWLHSASHRHACGTGDWRNCALPNAPVLAPLCVNPKCRQPRRPRRNRPGYTGGRDLCQPCYQRSRAEGFPAEVPGPKPHGDRWEAAREAQSAARAARLEDYRIYRSRGLTVLQAAAELDVAPTTAYGYEAVLRGQEGRPSSREERIAAFSGYRDGGCSLPVAARRAGVSEFTGQRYERELRRRQREGIVAA